MKQTKIPKAAAFGMTMGVLLSLVLGVLWTMLIRAGTLPESAMRYGCWIGAAVAGIITGAAAVKRAGKNAVPVALTAAGGYLLVTLVAGAVLMGWTGRGAAIHGALVLLTALVGGTLASGGKQKNRKPKYRV